MTRSNGHGQQHRIQKNYTTILDDVYQRVSVSHVLNSGRRMVREGRNAKEIMIPKIEVTGLGDYTRNVGYKTGSIDFEYETKTFNYDRGIRLMADVMDVEEAGLLDCFMLAGSELQRTQVAPEADAFTFAQIEIKPCRPFPSCPCEHLNSSRRISNRAAAPPETLRLHRPRRLRS